MLSAWKKLNRSFSGFCGWRQTRLCDQRSEKVNAVKAVIVTPSELVDVALQVAAADGMMRAVNTPLHLRPEALNRVRVSLASGVFAKAVIDPQVRKSKLRRVVIDRQFIGDNGCASRDVLADMSNDICRRHIINDLRGHAASALDNANDGRFTQSPATALASPFAADISLISFNDTRKQIAFAGHKLADFVTHTVSAFVSHAKLPREFFRRDSVFALGKKENGKEPSFETGFRFVENRASRRRNVRSAKRAAILPPFGNPVEAITLPALANVVSVASAENVVQTRSIVGKLRVKVFEVIRHFYLSEMRIFRNPCHHAAPSRNGNILLSSHGLSSATCWPLPSVSCGVRSPLRNSSSARQRRDVLMLGRLCSQAPPHSALDFSKHFTDWKSSDRRNNWFLQKNTRCVRVEATAKHYNFLTGQKSRILAICDMSKAIIPSRVWRDGFHFFVIPFNECCRPNEAIKRGQNTPFEMLFFKHLAADLKSVAGVSLFCWHRLRSQNARFGCRARDNKQGFHTLKWIRGLILLLNSKLLSLPILFHGEESRLNRRNFPKDMIRSKYHAAIRMKSGRIGRRSKLHARISWLLPVLGQFGQIGRRYATDTSKNLLFFQNLMLSFSCLKYAITAYAIQ
jgi:hypothetical protein